jgi:dipeptidyl aminopeptidase/acylaminoacyl peptidase
MPINYPLENYLNIRSAGSPTFSPDSRTVAFITNITGIAQVWQVPVGGGWPTQLTFTNESVRGVRYHPRRHELIYSMDSGGNERTQLYWLRGVAGNTDHGLGDGWLSTDLSRQPAAIHTFGDFNSDGTQFVFSANRDDAARFDVYVQAWGQAEARLVARGPGGYFTALCFSPDGRTVLVLRTESNTKQELHLIELANGRSRRLAPREGVADAQFRSASFSPDGRFVYAVTTVAAGAGRESRDLAGLARIAVENGQVEYVQTPGHEVEAVVPSPRGEWVAWLVNVDGRSRLHLTRTRDLAGNQHWVPELPLGVVNTLTFAPDESKLAVGFDGPRHNPDIHLLDVTQPGRPLSQLTRSSRAGVAVNEFAEPELIRYRTFDERMIPAWFYRPAVRAGELPPVIVYPHGGPESQTRPQFNALFQYFVANGYGVLAPNVRGSTGYGTAFMNLDNVERRLDAVNDLAHAAFWLRDQRQGDPRRLAVYGGSYGGFMVLAAVTRYPDLFAAGINVVGIANFITFLERTGPYRRAHREGEYGSLERDREFLQRISPINMVDRIRCPMMVIHGANDPRVPIGEAEQIVAALRMRMIPVEYLRYEDEGHGIARLRNRLDCYPRMVAFLDRHVKNRPQ